MASHGESRGGHGKSRGVTGRGRGTHGAVVGSRSAARAVGLVRWGSCGGARTSVDEDRRIIVLVAHELQPAVLDANRERRLGGVLHALRPVVPINADDGRLRGRLVEAVQRQLREVVARRIVNIHLRRASAESLVVGGERASGARLGDATAARGFLRSEDAVVAARAGDATVVAARAGDATVVAARAGDAAVVAARAGDAAVVAARVSDAAVVAHTSHWRVAKRILRPSGDHSTCESCSLSSLPHSRLPSTEPTITAPSCVGSHEAREVRCTRTAVWCTCVCAQVCV